MRLLSLLFLTLLLVSCPSPSGPGTTPGGEDPDPPVVTEIYLIPRSLWGEWRDSSGCGYYFASDMLFFFGTTTPPETYAERMADRDVTKYAPTNEKGAALPTFRGLALAAVPGESDLYIVTTSSFERALSRASSSATVKGIAMSGSLSTARGLGRDAKALVGGAGISLVLINVLNAADRITTSSTDSSGAFVVEGALAGDLYSIAAGEGAPAPVTVVPGETDAGLIPEINDDSGSGGALPKLVLDPGTSESWRYGGLGFAWAGEPIRLSYSIRNPGSESIAALAWTISTSGGSITSGSSAQITTPLAAGGRTGAGSTGLEFTPAAIPETEDFVYTKFSVDFTMGEQTWSDSFQIRVFREPMTFSLSSYSATVLFKTPIGTFASELVNNLGFSDSGAMNTTPDEVVLPYLRGDWELTLSRWYSGIHPYAWSCEGPMLPDAAIYGITSDPNEPNDTPSSATSVGFRDLAFGLTEPGDYDCFKLTLPEPAEAAAFPSVETLYFPSSETLYRLYDLGIDVDGSGNPKVAALWNKGTTYSPSIELGAWEGSGVAWSPVAATSSTASKLALKATTGGMEIILAASKPEYKAFLSGTWQAGVQYDLSGGIYPYKNPSGGLFALVTGTPIHLLSCTSGVWTDESVTAAFEPAFVVQGAASPEFLTRDSVNTLYALTRRNADGSWTLNELIVPSDEKRFLQQYQYLSDSYYFRPTFTARDPSTQSLYVYWGFDPIPGTSRDYFPPLLLRKPGLGGAETGRFFLPAGTIGGAGDSSGQPWVLVGTDSDVWFIHLAREGVWDCELLYAPGTTVAGRVPLMRSVRNPAGGIDVLWLDKPSSSSYTGASLKYLRVPGY